LLRFEYVFVDNVTAEKRIFLFHKSNKKIADCVDENGSNRRGHVTPE